MITRTIYIPANQIGRYILNYIVDNIPCSIGTLRRVVDTLAVVITVTPNGVTKLERILKMYDLS
jgi:hypothetical protein